jgi:hypothetical protein
MILGGTLFELLEHERGPQACRVMVSRLRRGGGRASIELAFGEPASKVERTWRAYLRDLPARRGLVDEFDEFAGLDDIAY